EKNLGGIKEMKELPGILFVIDTHKEAIAVAEARRMGIPIVAVVDTNCNPEGIDYPIPGNDDAIRAITLFTSIIANAVVEANNEEGLKIIENLQDEDEENLSDASNRSDDEEIVDYSNYEPTEQKEEDIMADESENDDLVDEDKLYK
ncbi:MAG: 30S ribosomal protein S2, partial [Spirochaetales bacterium]|nr:30S ribosomal protein S2 [Spirochaetales bacterium]